MPSGCSASERPAEGSLEDEARIQELMDLREDARANKDFARADEIRDQIAAAGYELRDTPKGPVVEKAPSF